LELDVKNYIQITVKIRKPTYEIEFGRTFLSAFIESDVRLTPEFFDVMKDRSINRRFIDIDHALEKWTTHSSVNVLGRDIPLCSAAKWTRKQEPKYSCYVDHMLITNDGSVSPGRWNFTAKWTPKIDWLNLFRSICHVCDAQAGMLHHFTSPEIRNPPSDFAIGIIAPAINPRFKDISWAMMFGDDFVHAVDVEKLTALGFPVEAVGSGYLVRVTDSLLDVSQRFDYFCERRELLRANLPRDIFTDPDEAEANRAEIERLIKERDAKAQLS
jgi:hypothetical protein